jgi:hypothetical protein
MNVTHLQGRQPVKTALVRTLAALAAILLITSGLDAQTKRTTPAKPAPRPAAKPAAKPEPPPPPAPRIELAMVNCPQVLGTGTMTMRTYCEVQVGNDAAVGIIVTLPPHTGPVRLMFDLHNRHTYSADLVKAKKAYTRYTARIGVLTMNNFLITRAAISNEFRTEADLYDRISGGSGPGGLKAVAPTGIEAIEVQIPEENQSVSILGERLSVQRMDDADTYTTTGRPVALISNVRVEYTPPPPPPPPKPTRTTRPATRR